MGTWGPLAPIRARLRRYGRGGSGARGPKPGRTIRDIGAAAVELADRGGLRAVSMRSVSTRLGLSPMALYTYVEGAAALRGVMVEHVIEEQAPLPRGPR